LSLQEIKPQDAAKAVRTLVRYIEQLEETARRNKMPEVTLSEKELRELDVAEEEMDRGKSLTLGKFNQGLKSTVHRNRTS